MAQYNTDFIEYDPGAQPADWTVRWVTSSSTWTSEDEGVGSPSDNVLRHTATASGKRLLSWDVVDSDADRADSEILCKFKTTSTVSFQNTVNVRGAGAAGTEDAYTLFFGSGSGTVSLWKFVSGTATQIGTTAFAHVANTYYWFRLRANGTTIQARVWADGDSEPGTWDIDVTDGDVTAAGFVGAGANTSSGTREFDFFSIATNGETAEGPEVSPSDARVTQASFLALVEGTPDARVTQGAVLVMYEPGPDARVTQALLLALHSVTVDARVTQTAILALVDVVACLTKWAQTWTITRTDGQVFAFTSLDRDLTFRGVVHQSCDSLSASATEMSSALGSTGSMELQGLISDTSITNTDLFNGLFDGAFIEVWSVPWEDVGGEIPFRLLAGTLGDVAQGTVGFTAEIISPGAILQQKPLLDTYGPGCRYKLGDTRCGFDLDTLEVSGAVTSLPEVIAPNSSRRRIFTDSARVEADRFYEFGEVTWTSGDNIGLSSEVKDFSGGTFTLWAPALNKIQLGDAYTAKPGCDKTAETCTTKFNIFVNFGGYPDVPGQDRILQTPDAK